MLFVCVICLDFVVWLFKALWCGFGFPLLGGLDAYEFVCRTVISVAAAFGLDVAFACLCILEFSAGFLLLIGELGCCVVVRGWFVLAGCLLAGVLIIVYFELRYLCNNVSYLGLVFSLLLASMLDVVNGDGCFGVVFLVTVCWFVLFVGWF